jgi:hypothetical protein
MSAACKFDLAEASTSCRRFYLRSEWKGQLTWSSEGLLPGQASMT